MLFICTDRIESLNAPTELRLDLLPRIDFDEIHSFLKASPFPILITPRKALTEEQIERLLQMEPAYFDLEWDSNAEFLLKVMHRYPLTQFILSYHNFDCTPIDLEPIYQHMAQFPAFTYKIATIAHSALDAMRLLLFAKSHPKVSAISMGHRGSFARVLGPIAGNLIGIGRGQREIAPGQLAYNDLAEIYRYHSLNRNTAVYALIGDPVEQSIGHLHHNRIFRDQNRNAVYVKIPLRPEEVKPFIPLAKQLNFRGLSVTMPLKELFGPDAINTIRFDNDQITCINTDGAGALDAIEKRIPVRDKTLLILGAGGAAQAIAHEAKKRGAILYIHNRTAARAQQLAEKIGCQAHLPLHYDIIVNCTPDPMPFNIQPRAIAMDIVYAPRETPFLQEAARKHCTLIYGEEMFFNQAARQTAFWHETTETILHREDNPHRGSSDRATLCH